MSLLSNDAVKEQQRINDIEQKIKRERAKLDKKLTRQKIVLGTFLVDALEKNAVHGLKEYTAKNLPDFLTRKSDKDAFKDMVESLGGVMTSEEKSENNDDINHQSQHQHQNQY